ncbi:MAG TPA: ferredoxin--NADP reductase [Planctomycetaceae bacterium]|nr:ferredoxin--NADP reductase [Planctomycetaceae bacterium]
MYNSQLVGAVAVHESLRILRVRPDWGRFQYQPGQYTVLGLGDWEPCVGQAAPAPDGTGRLIQRAYSCSASLLDPQLRLVRPGDCPYVEFYVTLVRRPGGRPGLTPRLFALRERDRLFIGRRGHGRYTLEYLDPDDEVVFAATGTGEAPHNAMVAELLARGHRGGITSVTCVRRKQDLAYLAAHRELERQFQQYRYLFLTTREPENVDPGRPDYVGKRYLQDYFESGQLEGEIGPRLDPARTHVYLCGNPVMIGAPSQVSRAGEGLAQSTGMIEVLQRRGFALDEPDRPGNIHFEKYW